MQVWPGHRYPLGATYDGIGTNISIFENTDNLDAALQYCGIPEEPRPHNALTGAKCNAEVISRLLHDKKLLPEFEQYGIPWIAA